jgi:hypothetical protein
VEEKAELIQQLVLFQLQKTTLDKMAVTLLETIITSVGQMVYRMAKVYLHMDQAPQELLTDLLEHTPLETEMVVQAAHHVKVEHTEVAVMEPLEL